MRTMNIRLGAAAAAIAFLAACSNDASTSPAVQANNGISARGGSSTGGGGGGGGSTSGSVYTGVLDSVALVNVGVYYPSYQDVYYTGSHSFRATTTTKIHSSSDLPLQAGACAQFQYTLSGGFEYTSDIKVLTVDKCGV